MRARDFLQSLKDLTVKIERAAAKAFEARYQQEEHSWQRNQSWQRNEKDKMMMKMMDLSVKLTANVEEKGEETQQRGQERRTREKNLDDFIAETNFTEVITTFTRIFLLFHR